jgi:hypothetical protein
LVFKRRNPRNWLNWAKELVYPTGGFRRATQYLIHRMRRLPDAPHRVARGVFAGMFVNFPPLFGVQLLSAVGLAWVMRGNLLAAALCTFLSNPITTPFIAILSLELGHWILGITQPLDIRFVFGAFADAGEELWHNAKSLFGDEVMRWGKLGEFWRTIYFPYLVGSILPGLIFALGSYYVTLPLVHAYQRLRHKRLRDRVEQRRADRAALRAEDQAGPGDPPV